MSSATIRMLLVGGHSHGVPGDKRAAQSDDSGGASEHTGEWVFEVHWFCPTPDN